MVDNFEHFFPVKKVSPRSVVLYGILPGNGISLFLEQARPWRVVTVDQFQHTLDCCYCCILVQDKEFDSQIGVKSTAQRFADHPQLWMSGFAAAMTCGLASTGWICQQPWPYFLGVGLFAAHLGHQVTNIFVPLSKPAVYLDFRNGAITF